MAVITVESTVSIDAPREDIWAFVSDSSRYPEWSVVTEKMTFIEETPVEAGSVYREIGGLGPFSGESEWIVTAFEPPRRQVHIGDDGTVQTTLTIELESDGESTVLHQTIALAFPRGMRVIAKVLGVLFMRRMAANALEETVQNAKQLIETGELIEATQDVT